MSLLQENGKKTNLSLDQKSNPQPSRSSPTHLNYTTTALITSNILQNTAHSPLFHCLIKSLLIYSEHFVFSQSSVDPFLMRVHSFGVIALAFDTYYTIEVKSISI